MYMKQKTADLYVEAIESKVRKAVTLPSGLVKYVNRGDFILYPLKEGQRIQVYGKDYCYPEQAELVFSNYVEVGDEEVEGKRQSKAQKASEAAGEEKREAAPKAVEKARRGRKKS